MILLPSSFLKILRNIQNLMKPFVNLFYLSTVQLHLSELIGTRSYPDIQKIWIIRF